jgi:hypothetical protein
MFSHSTPIYGNPSKTVSTATNTQNVALNRHKLVRSWSLFSPEIAQEKHWAMDSTDQRVVAQSAMLSAGKYTN